MPVVSAQNLTRLRTARHATRLALSVYHPASIWTAQVDGLQTTGDTTITVKTVVQVKAPAKNYLVLFGTTAGGSDLGTARWKSYSAPTLTVGAHNVALANDTYITVVEEIKPAAVHPNISATDVVTEDGNTAYTNENLQYMPLAKMGAPAVAYIDAATGLATVKFYSRSEAFGGATLSTYAWVFPSGTPGTSATAGTAGVPVTVTWNTAGQYYVSLTVTDSNGKTHTGYRPVFIYDSSTVPYTRIEVGGLEGDAESGVWSTHLTVHGDADAAEFPANALCVLSAIDYYGAEQVSIGNETWRENIVFVGYIRKGTAKIDRLHGFVEFDVDSVSGVADNIWQIGGGLETTAGTPGGWHTLQNMTYNLAAHHVLTQHSTVTQVADCYPNLPTYTIEYVDLTDASLMENLRQVCAAPRGRIGCNAQGALYLEINPQLQSLASRSVSYVLTTQNADVRDEIDLGDELQEKQVSQVDFAGEDATAAPVFSLAPENPWAMGHSEKVDGIRVANQTEANEFAGLYEAYDNNTFGDVVINWRGNYRVFDTFPAEPLAVTFTAAQNTRGVAWTAQRCWVKRVSYEYRAGILLASAVVEKDSYGALGVTGDYPATEPTPTMPPPPAEPPIIDPPAPTPQLLGKGNLLYVSSLKGVAKCTGAYGTDGTDGAPVWTAINSGLSGNALKVRMFNLDPWSSSGDHFTAAYAMTDDGLYRCTGLPDAPVWTQVLSPTNMATLLSIAPANIKYSWNFAVSVRTAGFVWVLAGDEFNIGGGGIVSRVHSIWSTDYGANWTADSAHYVIWWQGGSAWDTLQPFASYHLDNTYYIGGGTASMIGDEAHIPNWWELSTYETQIVKSTNLANGFAWNSGVEIAQPSAHMIYCPVTCNNAGVWYTDDATAWHVYALENNTVKIGRSTAFFTVTPLGNTPPYGLTPTTAKSDAAMSNTLKNFFANMFNEDKGSAIDATNIWMGTSLSGTPSWTRYNAPTIGGRVFNPRYMFAIPIDANIWWFTGKATTVGGVACVPFTIDFGSNWADASQYGTGGALDTVLGLALGDMDGSQIVVDYYKP